MAGCASPEETKLTEKEILFSLRLQPAWFNYRKDRSYLDSEGKTFGHSFFDFSPFINVKNATLNFFVVTPRKSNILYDFDLNSGKRFRDKFLCMDKDVWESYDGPVHKPLFTEGIVPRTIDQTGSPQKIWIFGQDERFEHFPALYSHRAKVVGGVVEQRCLKTHCESSKDWESKLILIGVAPQDEHFSDVDSLSDLKSKVEWEYVKAYAQNYQGNYIKENKPYPAFRLTGNISQTEALRFAIKNSSTFDKKDMLNVLESCHKIYDFMEKSLGPKTNKQGYYKRFKSFHRKYSSKYRTCMKYVKSSSVNKRPQTHWDFSFIEAFYRLHDLNYVYHCRNKAWIKKDSLQAKNLIKAGYLNICKDHELDSAFSNAVFTLDKLYQMNMPTYRYIEYDTKTGGSHEKLYSWVYSDGLYHGCAENKHRTRTFPLDVRWQSKITK